MDWPLPIRILLLPLSWVYGTVVRCKTLLYETGVLRSKRLPGAVISVGNLTVGGTGKTPMVMRLAQKFVADGKRVAILSRGYRGAAGTSDEIEVMKQRLGGRVRFGVGPDRFAEGEKLQQAGPVDVFILDDGFQHRQLARDVDIVMLDGSRRLKREWLLPAGRLREPIGACRRADLLVVTRKFARPAIAAGDSHEHRIFYAQNGLVGFRKIGEYAKPAFLSEIGSGPYFAFCGIGNPRGFFDDLQFWHATLAGTKQFGDHHTYSQADVVALESLALKSGATALMTTEKDEQNLRHVELTKFPVYVAVIECVLSSENEFHATLDGISSKRRNRTR